MRKVYYFIWKMVFPGNHQLSNTMHLNEQLQGLQGQHVVVQK